MCDRRHRYVPARRRLLAGVAAAPLARVLPAAAQGPVAASGPGRPAAGDGAASAGGAEPGYEWRPWPKNKGVPRLELEAPGGARWRLADQRGRVLLANFWASWCGPCRIEMPTLARLAAKRGGQGLTALAVNYAQGPDVAERWMAGLGLAPAERAALTLLFDRDGKAAAAWTPRIFPSTVVFGRGGRPAGVLVGEIDWESPAAIAIVEPLLAG